MHTLAQTNPQAGPIILHWLTRLILPTAVGVLTLYAILSLAWWTLKRALKADAMRPVTSPAVDEQLGVTKPAVDLVPASAMYRARVHQAQDHTIEDLAELVYVTVELGDEHDGWRRLWRELTRIGAHPDRQFLAEIGFSDIDTDHYTGNDDMGPGGFFQ